MDNVDEVFLKFRLSVVPINAIGGNPGKFPIYVCRFPLLPIIGKKM